MRASSQAPPGVRPEGDGLPIKAHIIDFETEDLRLSPPGEQERREEFVGERQGDPAALRRALGLVDPRRFEQSRRRPGEVSHFIPTQVGDDTEHSRVPRERDSWGRVNRGVRRCQKTLGVLADASCAT